VTVDDMMSLVARVARDVAADEDVSLPEDLGPDTPLFGKAGLFDSLGLVNLILALEEAIQDDTGVAVTLADERAMSQARSPFRTVGSLAGYAFQMVEEAVAAGG
jgi:D-alanine--poly(phosphoribitol) ligase subunit 2